MEPGPLGWARRILSRGALGLGLILCTLPIVERGLILWLDQADGRVIATLSAALGGAVSMESMEVRLEADGIGFGDIVLRGDDRREHADSLSGRAV